MTLSHISAPGAGSDDPKEPIPPVVLSTKSDDLPDDFYRSHWRWQARTFWFALLWFVVTRPLWFLFVFPGWAAYVAIGLWYLYRCLRGWIAFNDRRPMYA